MKLPKLLLSLALMMFTFAGYSQPDFRTGYYISNQGDTIYGEIDHKGNWRSGRTWAFRKLKSSKTILYVQEEAGYSQPDFRPGYCISNHGDTIYGEIDYRGNLRCGKVCGFRELGSSETVMYFPGEIQGYRFDLGKYYVSAWVRLEQENENRQVFAEYLVNGIADLLYYRSGYSEHYLIEIEDGRSVELIDNHMIIDKDGQDSIVNTNQNMGLLIAAFSDCPKILPVVQKTQLTHNSLIKLTTKYHDYVCDEEKSIVYLKEFPKLLATIAPVISLGLTSAEFVQHTPQEQLSFDISFSRLLGIQVNFFAPRINDKISLQIEAGISKDYFYCSRSQEFTTFNKYQDIHLRTTFFDSSFGLKYTYSKGRFRPTFAIGGVFRSLIHEDWEYIIEQESEGIVTTTISNLNGLLINSPYGGATLQTGVNYHLTENLVLFSNLKYQYSSAADNSIFSKTVFQSLSMVVGINF